MPQACLAGACPIRRSLVGGIPGAPNKVRRGWPARRSPGGQAQRAGRYGRRHQGSTPDGRDAQRGAGRSPRARRRNAGMHSNKRACRHRAPYTLSAATSDSCRCPANAVCVWSAAAPATRGDAHGAEKPHLLCVAVNYCSVPGNDCAALRTRPCNP